MKKTNRKKPAVSSVPTVREAALQLLKTLPADCTWDDVMYRVYVRQKIEAGIKDAEEGRLISDDEVFKEFEQ